MTAEIQAFVASVAHVTNIAKALLDARDEMKRSSLVIEFNEAIGDLQTKRLAVVEKNQALLAANEALNKQLETYDKWEQEKARYKLKNVGVAAVVYALDPDKASGDSLHWLCPHCYEQRKKGVFQRHGKTLNHYKCDGCGSEIDALANYPSANTR